MQVPGASLLRTFLSGRILNEGSEALALARGAVPRAVSSDGRCTARFETKLKSGRYEVRLAYSQNANRATNVPVVVHHAAGSQKLVVNQRKQPPIDNLFILLGEFDFSSDTPAAVTISNESTDGYVIIDAVQWLPK